jgi:ATP-dependent exoDNAse (exonuclease V) alpha subunit
MIADIAFHKLDSDNPHFHVMLTTRKLTPDGSGFGQKVREWNSKEQLEGWRKSWADTANEHMQRAGIDARIDHRSLKDQKAELDAIPPHRGATGAGYQLRQTANHTQGAQRQQGAFRTL